MPELIIQQTRVARGLTICFFKVIPWHNLNAMTLQSRGKEQGMAYQLKTSYKACQGAFD